MIYMELEAVNRVHTSGRQYTLQRCHCHRCGGVIHVFN